MLVSRSSIPADVSQVIAAIDWAVEHRDDPELNIRVLNLSFGTASAQDVSLDPLSHAVEVAGKSGIVVVVSAGNDGADTALRMPACNHYVLAVGAAHNNGTNSLDDDLVADFPNEGTPARAGTALHGRRRPQRLVRACASCLTPSPSRCPEAPSC